MHTEKCILPPLPSRPREIVSGTHLGNERLGECSKSHPTGNLQEASRLVSCDSCEPQGSPVKRLISSKLATSLLPLASLRLCHCLVAGRDHSCSRDEQHPHTAFPSFIEAGRRNVQFPWRSSRRHPRGGWRLGRKGEEAAWYS